MAEAPTRPSNLEPTATDIRTWVRKAAERINYLLNENEALKKRVTELENP